MRKTLFDQTLSRYKSAVPTLASSKENQVPCKHHASFGKVPSYLVRREANKVEQEKLELERSRLAEIPEGYRYMSSEEVSLALDELEAQRQSQLDKLKRLPLRIETLGQRREKLSIELVLMDLDKSVEKLTRRNKCLIKLCS